MKPAQPHPYRTDDSSIGPYLHDISRYRPLSSREESEIAVRIRNGDHSALQHLVKTNLRFVVSVARNYQHQGMALPDLINEGNLGLIRAARRFDEKKNFRFISYAVWWVRQAILQSLAEHSRILRIPLNRVGTIHRVGRARCHLEQRFRREPDSSDIACALNIPRREVEHSLCIGTAHTSLDAPAGEESTDALGATIRDEHTEPPDHFTGEESMTREIGLLLDGLPGREKQVLSLYYGIGSETTHTLDEIGEILGLTRERVRQIREKALNRLRRRARKGVLAWPQE